jgi:hypothetical protein
MSKTLFKSVLALSACVLFAGCATTTKVATQQPGDETMTCEALKGEFAKLDAVGKEAIDNKGVTTANVAAVLFFWPAAVGNYMDADKAEKLVQERRLHLMTIYRGKSCT